MHPEIWIGLGSNLGDRSAHLHLALRRISELGQIKRISNIYETAPWGKVDQPEFLNAVCSLNSPMEDAQAFFTALKQIECQAGRKFREGWGPRELDLDLLFWGAETIASQRLTVPHPRIAERRFVLVPLAEVAADLIHPISGLTVQQMLVLCQDTGAVRLDGEFNVAHDL